jgi:hypothetical protein
MNITLGQVVTHFWRQFHMRTDINNNLYGEQLCRNISANIVNKIVLLEYVRNNSSYFR